MFRSLQTKLTVLYAGLFAIALGLLSGAVYLAAAGNAETVVRNQLTATGSAFDRIWDMQTSRLADSADILSKDFGFRDAVATRDDPTIISALDNLRDRLGFDLAFIIDVDGNAVGTRADISGLFDELGHNDRISGVTSIGGKTYQTISAPVRAPTLIGWLVFASELNRAEMQSLESLSAIPLSALVLTQIGGGDWHVSGEMPVYSGTDTIRRMAADLVRRTQVQPDEIELPYGTSLALAKPLPAVGEGNRAALLLEYPLTEALAPFRPLFYMLTAFGLAGLALIILASSMLARNLTRPIASLDLAVQRLRDGDYVPAEVQTRDEIGRLASSFNLMSDGIRKREAEISHMALHDPESELPNRRALQQQVNKMREGLASGRIAVAAIGIDRFAVLRGSIGFALSGALVRAIGGRIGKFMPDWALGRLSTSDLMVAFPVENTADATARIEHLLAVLAAPYTLSGNKVDVGFTAGIVLMDRHGETTINQMDQASVAVDQARASFRHIALFDPVAYGDPSSNLSLISDMMAGMTGGEMSLHFQPKLDLRAGRVTAAEALIRWSHPERGMVRPDLFVEMAEETGHIRPLTDWVLNRALSDHEVMKKAGCPIKLSINISGRVLGDPEFAELACRLARESDADLVYEITETAVIDNPKAAMKAIEDWKAAGIGISIDDYGSGLSSLAYLKQIKANELKIDRSLVASLAEDRRDALMVKSTIDMAHGLGMYVTAEGIEDNDVLSALSVMGCDFAQGYYIARPMPLDAFCEFMANWHAPNLPKAGQGGV